MKLADWLASQRRQALGFRAADWRVARRGDADLPGRRAPGFRARRRSSILARDARRRDAQRFSRSCARPRTKEKTCRIPSPRRSKPSRAAKSSSSPTTTTARTRAISIVAASLCTPEKMAFIIRNCCGIVCAPLTAHEAQRLHLAADGGDERRAARHRLHRLGRYAPRPDHRHFRRAALQHGSRARQRQYGRERFRAPRPCLPAHRQGGRRADALGPYRGGGRSLQARRAAAGRGHLRTRQRRRHGHGRAADRGLRAQAQSEAHFGRRSHRLSAGAREAGRARRRLSREDADRRTRRLCLSHAVRCGAAFRLRARLDRRRPRRAGAAAPRRHSRRHFRRRRASRACCSASRTRGAACWSICATARRACPSTSPAPQPQGSDGERAMQWREDRPRRADPARSRRVLDPAAHARTRANMSASPASASRSRRSKAIDC